MFLDENPIEQIRQLLNMAINLLIRIHSNEKRSLFYLGNMSRITSPQTCWTKKILNFIAKTNRLIKVQQGATWSFFDHKSQQ